MYRLRCFIQHRQHVQLGGAGKTLTNIARITRPQQFVTTKLPRNYTTVVEESSKPWRKNPNLKYWVIGVSAITGIIYRYVYKEKDKKKIIVKNLPALPSHKLHSRATDLTELYNMYKVSQCPSVSSVYIQGGSGSGKTVMASALAEKLAKEHEQKYHFLPPNLFVGTINASNLDTLLFDIKKFAVAIGCQTKDWLLRIEEGVKFGSLSDSEQLHVISDAVKEKLAQNPNWILIFDNLHDNAHLQAVFGDDMSSWGKGTVIITTRNALNNEASYCLDKGMTKEEATELLKQLTGLSDDKLDNVQQVFDVLGYSPLAVSYSGALIKSRLELKKEYSIRDFIEELKCSISHVHENNQSKESLLTNNASYAVTSLLIKDKLDSSPHFLHTFDLLGSCSPFWPIPVSLISLHLRSPEYYLPQVPRGAPVLPDLPDQGEIKPVKPEQEVEESFFSIKRLANNLESFTTAVKANYDAIKEMFNPPPMDFSSPSDGVLELMQTCPFISAEKINPGGVQTVKVSAIAHEVMCQLFSTNTAYLLEEKHLIQAQERHNNSSWFRRLWKFDSQRSLQEFRNSLRENVDEDTTLEYISTVKHNYDVSGLLKDDSRADDEGYRAIQPTVASDHFQRHIGLILKTMNGVSSVCSQDVQTRTLARLIMPHLHHILTTNTSRSLAPKSRAHALLAVASINSALGNLEASIPSLEQAVTIEEEQFGDSSLEVASSLTRLAEVYSSLDNASKARILLERAFSIYEQHRKKAGEYKKPLEFARTMEALGAVYGALGFKQQSKDYIERALSFMQSAAPTTPDEIEGRRFTCEVASTLTDLGHAYLSLGDAFSGRKMLELAVTGLKNMYGDEHPEVVRAMTILGTAYTMQGNWQEGKNMRKQAGKLQAKIDTVVAL